MKKEELVWKKLSGQTMKKDVQSQPYQPKSFQGKRARARKIEAESSTVRPVLQESE